MNTPSGMSRAELDMLAGGYKPLPKGMKNRDGSKATYSRKNARTKNRQRRRSRAKNRKRNGRS